MLLDPHISEKVGYADNQKRMYSSLQIKGSGQLGILRTDIFTGTHQLS